MIQQETHPTWPDRLTASAIVLAGVAGTVLFVSHVVPLSLFEVFGTTESSLVMLALPFGLWRFALSALLLGHLSGYLLACGGVLALSTIALLKSSGSRPFQAFIVVIIGSVLWFMLAPYRPAVHAADGYRMQVATAPQPLLNGLRNAQAWGEIKPCRYTLLGWEGNTLFFQGECGQQLSLWHFNPSTMSRAVPYSGSVPTQLQAEIVPHIDVLEWVRSDARPAEVEPMARELAIRGDVMRSPDGQSLAVVSRHVYAVEDVLLLTPSE